MKGTSFSIDRGSILLLLFGLFVLFTPILFVFYKVFRYTNGVFMYPLDDTFIHLELAKNLAHGVWGINNEFASASSSLLYTIILSIVTIFSDHVSVPFFINCFSGIIIIWSLHKWLQKHQVVPVAQCLIILLTVFFTPLILTVVTGMEHTIQCLVSFLFIFHFSDWLEEFVAGKEKKITWQLLIFTLFVSTIRYEGLFLIAVAVLMLLYFKKIRAATIFLSIALLPLVAFGTYSVLKGGFFLPNSVLIKSESFKYTGLTGIVSNILFEKLTFARNGMAALATQRWLIILPLLYLLFRKYMRPSYAFILFFLLAATILQLSLAATGYLYRYEAYLFFCSVVIISILFYKHGRQVLAKKVSRWPVVELILVFFLFFPITLRSITALEKLPQACINIFDQQYQMAKFSKQFYSNSNIAANDIGALSYYTDARIVDLWGLANNEVAKSKKNNTWTPAFLDSICKSDRVSFAMLYDVWFPNTIPGNWIKIATWQIQNNVICGDDTVSFYSLDSLNRETLLKNLKEYETQLPPSVIVQYY